MAPVARRPDELETMLEDASILRDARAAAELFEEHAVLSCLAHATDVRGVDHIGAWLARRWGRGHTYIADVSGVVQLRDVALTFGRALSVLASRPRRGVALRDLCPAAAPPRGGTTMTSDSLHTGPRVLGPRDGDYSGPPDGTHDRFLLDGHESGGRVALVEHRLEPRVLAAPLHIHTKEDEYSFVLEGDVGALLGDDEVVAGAGHLIFKPRGQWHTFWNAGDTPARILEVITPAGLEQLFRAMGEAAELDPETIATMAADYGGDVDFDATVPIIQRHGLEF